MLLRELLSVPYILEALSVKSDDGSWIRCFEYPELPDCTVYGLAPVEALDELERLKYKIILDRVQRGQPVPVPRPPLYSMNPGASLRDIGLSDWLIDLDIDVSELARS